MVGFTITKIVTTQAITTFYAMKGVKMAKPLNPVIPDYRPRAEKKVEDIGLPLKACCICKKISQPYGMWSDGHSCSRKCEAVKERMPRNIGEPHEASP